MWFAYFIKAGIFYDGDLPLIPIFIIGLIFFYQNMNALFGFMKNLESHLKRLPLNHSYCYAPAANRSTCLARFSLNSKSFIKHAN